MFRIVNFNPTNSKAKKPSFQNNCVNVFPMTKNLQTKKNTQNNYLAKRIIHSSQTRRSYSMRNLFQNNRFENSKEPLEKDFFYRNFKKKNNIFEPKPKTKDFDSDSDISGISNISKTENNNSLCEIVEIMENFQKFHKKRTEYFENSEKTTSYQSSKEISDKKKAINHPITFDNENLEKMNNNNHMIDLKLIRKNLLSREKNTVQNIPRAVTSQSTFRANTTHSKKNNNNNLFLHFDENKITTNLKNNIIKPQTITFHNRGVMNFIEESNFLISGVNPKYNDSHLKN